MIVALLLAHGVRGVVFTGSLATAKAIDAAMVRTQKEGETP